MRKFDFIFLAIGYLITAAGLFFYSYTQVDLNLTLSQWSVWKTIQTSFQYIGWFNRPLSTSLYLALLTLLFLFYYACLDQVKKNMVAVEQFWKLVFLLSIVLLFSYNAFSYDLFNYMFDARIVTYHHLSPYAYKALDFPHDPWINFMRWTHRTYPYGMLWLALTVPLSFIGFQYFLPTLFLFKGLMVCSYLGSVYFIGKIVERIAQKDKLFAMGLFALNPLVVIESLVSSHNDIVMMFFALMGIYFLLKRRYILAFISLIFSMHIKFINVSLPTILGQVIPVGIAFSIVGVWLMNKKKKEINWALLFWGISMLMVLAIIFASQRTELQPWYLLWVLPILSLIPARNLLVPLIIVISLGLLLHYVPFLYTGNWNSPIPMIKSWLTASAICIGIASFVVAFVREKQEA
jgi:hypothetical protein